jgi:cyanate lyase
LGSSPPRGEVVRRPKIAAIRADFYACVPSATCVGGFASARAARRNPGSNCACDILPTPQVMAQRLHFLQASDAQDKPGLTRARETTMKRSDLTEKLLDIKRDNGWSWKHICEKIGGFSDVLIVGALLGQMKLTKPQAANAAELFGLSKSEAAMLNEIPMRGEGTPMPPTDPLIYRLYELVMVNGPAWKALIEEEFGDGIMSAIDFDMAMERVANPKGDRVKITMSGKFLPFKYYGATGNVPEYGFKEG